MIDSSKYYVFYDGNCGFCNYWVQNILKNDEKNQFLFSSLQSEFGQNFLNERGLESKDLSTLYLWKPQSFYLSKSPAVFEIANVLGGKYKLISFLRYLPQTMSDMVYEKMAENRSRFASRKCFLPNEKEKEKFIE